MKLESGYYKISRGDKLNRNYHLLKVWREERKKYIQIDHGYPQVLSADDENDFFLNYQIIEVYSSKKPLEISDPRIIVEFNERGTPIYLHGKSLMVLRRILDEFPRLFKALGGKRIK